MKPGHLERARLILGNRWGLDRPLRMSELGRAIDLTRRDPGASVKAWETGKTPISPTVENAVMAMLYGFKPLEYHRLTKPRQRRSGGNGRCGSNNSSI